MMERRALWQWTQDVQVGRAFRKDLEILQLTRAGEVLRTYTVERAWPVEWSGASLDSLESRIPVESLKLAYEHVSMEVEADAK